MKEVKQIIDLPEGGAFIIDKIETIDGYYNFIITGERITPKGDTRPSTIYLRTYKKTFEDITILEHWMDWFVIEDYKLEAFKFVPIITMYLPNGRLFHIETIHLKKGCYNFRLIGYVKRKDYDPVKLNYEQKIEVFVRSTANNIEDFFRCAWIDWEIKETEEI